MITNKRIHLFFDESNLEVEYSPDSDCYIFSIMDYQLDEEKSEPNHTVYKQKDRVEVYLDQEDIKGIVKSLQFLLSDEDK